MPSQIVAETSVAAILASLDPEQRAAATLPDGPAQIIAPAGSGKTTTMVARIAVLLSRGVRAERICVVTFNRDAAADLAARVERRLGDSCGDAVIEVRTLHALARQVLVGAGDGRDIVADRLPLLRAARRSVVASSADADAPEPSKLDTWLSAWKIEGRPPPDGAAAALSAYARLLEQRGAVDFDDLVVRAGDLLEGDAQVRETWQSRFSHVCVDEFQDVDAAQLRLVRLMAAPQDNLYVVGDDDQTIYAWRLADVRRILRFGEDYPTARRVMLATNYRCPASVIEASARLVAVNRERFDKPIRPPPDAPVAGGGGIGAVSTAEAGWTDALAALAAGEGAVGRSLCFLARTRGELKPIVVALVAAGVRHASPVPLAVESDRVLALVDDLRATSTAAHPFATLLERRKSRGWARGEAAADSLTDEDHDALDALLGWATRYSAAPQFLVEFDAARHRIGSLRDPNAPVQVATVHTSKGREWETVVLIGFEADRMPNRRSLADADDPERALEEERRLAYVALTRATRRLLLAFDPGRPSPFLAEMGYAAPRRAA